MRPSAAPGSPPRAARLTDDAAAALDVVLSACDVGRTVVRPGDDAPLTSFACFGAG